MPEQVWWVILLFWLLGHMGFVIRILWAFVMSGNKKLSAFDNYVEENSAVVLLGLLFYWGVCAVWLWTDAMSIVPEFVGIVPGELNGWTVAFGFLSDVLFMFLIDKFGEKIGAEKLGGKVSGLMPKLGGKDEPTPPAP